MSLSNPPLDPVRAASAQRREAERVALRRTILAAAGELLIDSGYAAFSMRKLAQRIGYTPTTVYHHFADKDTLLMAVVSEGFALFEERLRHAIYGIADPFDQVAALGRAYVRFGLEHPVHYRVMFLERADFWSTMPPDVCAPMMASFDVLHGIVQRAIATGDASHSDSEAVSHALWAQVHGVVTLALTMPFLEPATIESMTETSMALVLDGFRRR